MVTRPSSLYISVLLEQVFIYMKVLIRFIDGYISIITYYISMKQM